MFMSENLKRREQAAQGTTDFLKSQLEEAKRNLDSLDSKLAEFKTKYIGQLPGQEQNNMTVLNSLNSRLEATTQYLTRAQQDKTFIDSMLQQQVATWEANQAALAAAQAEKNDKAVDATDRLASNPNSLEKMEEQYTAMQNAMITLQTRYTTDYPDVVKLRHDMDVLAKRIENAKALKDKPVDPKAVAAAVTKQRANEPQEIQKLRYQATAFDSNIKEKTAEQENLKKQIAMYEARIQLSPKVEEEYKALTRDYNIAYQSYNDLLAKQTQSEMATNLERRQEGEQFRVMDPANLPERPSFPDRRLFAGGGIAVGVGVGFMIALLLEMRDKSIRTERDVEFYLELPVLVMLPRIGDGGAEEVAARRATGGGAAKLKFWKRKKADATGRPASEGPQSLQPAEAEVHV
jgi:uncharacterized protein involved in exopolysaccharide biosynthesis